MRLHLCEQPVAGIVKLSNDNKPRRDVSIHLSDGSLIQIFSSIHLLKNKVFSLRLFLQVVPTNSRRNLVCDLQTFFVFLVASKSAKFPWRSLLF